MEKEKEPIAEEISTKKFNLLNHRVPRLENLDKIGQNYEKLGQDSDKFDKDGQDFDNGSRSFDRVGHNFDRVGQSLDRVGQKLGQNWEKVGHLIEQTFDNGLKLDRITFESEKLRSHSESSSRRNSDDGGRAKKEGLRSDGTTSEPPTANISNHNAWGELNSSTSTTRTELSSSDGGEDQSKPRRRSHESALPRTPMHSKAPWKSADSLAPESAFGTSLADIMESPNNKVHLRDDIKSIISDSSEEQRPRHGWRFVRNVTSAAGAFAPKKDGSNTLPGTPSPFQVFTTSNLKKP